MIDPSAIRARFTAVGRDLNERTRRLFAAAEARTAGYGGVAASSRATGLARSTIGRGLKDLDNPASLSGEVRRPGSGRPGLTETDTTLLDDLRQLLEPSTKGDPMRPLRWVSKSHAKLAAALCTMGHQVSKSTIPKLLELLHYRRQVNRKTLESSRNPDRDAQFEHINTAAVAMQAAGKPVISIDTKKKELIGPYKNAGSDYRPEGSPEQVKVHDFIDAELGKVVPYGVYDVAANAGCVSVGIDNDTAQFAVNSIRRWLDLMGQERYPGADKLMITADGGGSNGSRVRLFKVELQKLADETGLTLQVCHYPPGTSKWNKIEHRLFCYITENWRGTPLTSRLAVVELIAATTTKAGLQVRCELDTRTYPKGIKVSDEEMAGLNIKGDQFHPEWNYTVSPRLPP
ncbi:ISAzo13 family transposase [Acidiphilium sp. AL]|uniref:ISAzo13 family transposase n=1 Tax=Acidiphilium sp. AL TaxID=2871704 RepID=UPI0021CB23FC|nr:ISAzo13 family transposase [Acidiphilium sp. AL]MCU4161815.1 ISAzo13 family transposase [Acidiphilium sp. AL]